MSDNPGGGEHVVVISNDSDFYVIQTTDDAGDIVSSNLTDDYSEFQQALDEGASITSLD